MTPTRVLLVVGVAGAGKTTLGRALADRLGWAFEDADDHHSAASMQKMARGEGLTDADRGPWLDRLGALVAARRQSGPPTVLACSALKAAYRHRLGVGQPGVEVVWLDAPAGVLRQRLAGRRGHVAGPDLLPSQLATLEPPAEGLRLDATVPTAALTEAVVRWIEDEGSQPA
ncbi:MAG: gluconokinase, GntK/IdnK-type [Bacteroidota bacterium]